MEMINVNRFVCSK